jgi:hypothetical protein
MAHSGAGSHAAHHHCCSTRLNAAAALAPEPACGREHGRKAPPRFPSPLIKPDVRISRLVSKDVRSLSFTQALTTQPRNLLKIREGRQTPSAECSPSAGTARGNLTGSLFHPKINRAAVLSAGAEEVTTHGNGR